MLFISPEDLELFHSHRWFIDTRGYLCYSGKVSAGKKFINIYFHRCVAERMGLDTSKQVDHINSIKLDNRRENLRPASHTENTRNASKRKDNKSGFKGVFKRRFVTCEKWYAYITVDKIRLHLGSFSDKESAARTYDAAAKQYFGEFAKFNFPEN